MYVGLVEDCSDVKIEYKLPTDEAELNVRWYDRRTSADMHWPAYHQLNTSASIAYWIFFLLTTYQAEHVTMSTIEHLLPYIPVSFLKLIYPLQESNRIRDRPLRVLCLGPGRTGTDSLREALKALGYDSVYHGYSLGYDGVGDTPQWERLNRAKYGVHKDASFLNKEQFDKVLGNSDAALDFPTAGFGVELLRAYPDAKIILNRRSNVDAWYRSQLNTIDKIYRDWPNWTRCWFESEAFFSSRALYWMRSLTRFDFKTNGKPFYFDHFETLEAELRRQNRPWLDWTVEQGYPPLCEFLGKDVPTMPFPSSNSPDNFNSRRQDMHGERTKRGFRNMRIAAGVVVVGLGCLVAYKAW